MRPCRRASNCLCFGSFWMATDDQVLSLLFAHHSHTVRPPLSPRPCPAPQDQYILQTAELQGVRLPFACRHGCCTACAVRVLSGSLAQPRALGISPELKAKGYALLCASVPLSDLEVETQDEDEVYWQQFGKYFARDKIERDDYALELAMQDE